MIYERALTSLVPMQAFHRHKSWLTHNDDWVRILERFCDLYSCMNNMTHATWTYATIQDRCYPVLCHLDSCQGPMLFGQLTRHYHTWIVVTLGYLLQWYLFVQELYLRSHLDICHSDIYLLNIFIRFFPEKKILHS